MEASDRLRVGRSMEAPEAEVAADHCGITVHVAGEASQIANVKKVAGVERRHDFAVRRKLWRGQPHERFRSEKWPAGSAGSKPSRG